MNNDAPAAPRFSFIAIASVFSVFGAVFGAGVSWGVQQTSGKATADTLATMQSTGELRNTNLGARIDLLETKAGARMDAMDRRDDLNRDRVGALDGRLNNLEGRFSNSSYFQATGKH